LLVTHLPSEQAAGGSDRLVNLNAQALYAGQRKSLAIRLSYDHKPCFGGLAMEPLKTLEQLSRSHEPFPSHGGFEPLVFSIFRLGGSGEHSDPVEMGANGRNG
jgi:hypothetical protein